jgi:hypothetical protein
VRPEGFLDALAVITEHEDVTNIEAFDQMCENAIAVYDGTDHQHVADGRERRSASWTNAADRRLCAAR